MTDNFLFYFEAKSINIRKENCTLTTLIAMPTLNATALTQTFTTTLQNHHTYAIRWARLGNPTNPPLIFIHGEPWSSRLWAPFALAFSKYFSVYLFDNPGYGETVEIDETNTGTKDVSLATQGEAFACLLASWEIQAPHIVAHDYGGLIALRAKLVHGAAYATLCLIDALALTPWGSPFFRLVLSHESVFEQINPPIFEGMLRAYIRQAAHKPFVAELEDTIAQVRTPPAHYIFIQVNQRPRDIVSGLPCSL